MLKYMTIGIVALVAAILGLGGGSGFGGDNPTARTIAVNSPAKSAYHAFATSTGDEYFASTLITHDIRDKISVKNDGSSSIVYTIASSEGSEAVIKLQVIPDPKNSNASLVTASYLVPPIKMENDQTKYLSQVKVANEGQKALKKFASAVSGSGDTKKAIQEFNMLMEMVAIVLNPAMKDRLQTTMKSGFDAFDSDDQASIDSGVSSSTGSRWDSGQASMEGKPSLQLPEEDTQDSFGSEPEFGDPAYNQ
ncbi:hypothetical protein ACFOWX_00505 [Sphingorhabdus arenilitoris]|uniref:DUF4230 domain-containing protein n=1 Tax=Sphingorhabdus arenilitoris TaxID=1490041 RepID=A0ABV8RDB1_9SPHN